MGVLTKPMLCTCWMRRKLYERTVLVSDSFIVVVCDYSCMLSLYVSKPWKRGANVFFHTSRIIDGNCIYLSIYLFDCF